MDLVRQGNETPEKKTTAKKTRTCHKLTSQTLTLKVAPATERKSFYRMRMNETQKPKKAPIGKKIHYGNNLIYQRQFSQLLKSS